MDMAYRLLSTRPTLLVKRASVFRSGMNKMSILPSC